MSLSELRLRGQGATGQMVSVFPDANHQTQIK